MNNPLVERSFKHMAWANKQMLSILQGLPSEHRAQISDILAANNMDVLNLDEIDLWSFEKWEKSILNK
jgi:hypothetical protein